MPLHWTIQTRPQLVTIVAEGDVSRQDIEAYCDMSGAAGLVEWRKLIDARKGRASFTLEDVNDIGVRIREAAAAGKVGPLAFVVPEIGPPELMRLLGFLSAAKRPMRLFHEVEPAEKWVLKAPL